MTIVKTIDPIETEAIRQIRSRIVGISKRQKLVWGPAARGLADELKHIFRDIKRNVSDRKKGITLLLFFFTTEKSILNHCDDSSGLVSDVFKEEGVSLFLNYAVPFEDRRWLAIHLVRKCLEDMEGALPILLENAVTYLTEDNVREMMEKLWGYAEDTQEEIVRDNCLEAIEILAIAMDDAVEYEKAYRARMGELHHAAVLQIGEMHLRSGKPKLALEWAQKATENKNFEASAADALLCRIYTALGEKEKARELDYRLFREYRTAKRFRELLDRIGEKSEFVAIDREEEIILQDQGLHYSDAQFLFDVGSIKVAAEYLIARRDKINGKDYAYILPLARLMAKENRYLCATVLYRALLEDILLKKKPKNYMYGVRYLGVLDMFGPFIIDWRGIEPHSEYRARIKEQHQLKSAFWSLFQQYQKEKGWT